MLNKTGFPGLTVIITKFETVSTGPELAKPRLWGFSGLLGFAKRVLQWSTLPFCEVYEYLTLAKF